VVELRLAFEIRGIVVERVFVPMVNVASGRNGTVKVLPDVPMQRRESALSVVPAAPEIRPKVEML
jgi:hypothetical protein